MKKAGLIEIGLENLAKLLVMMCAVSLPTGPNTAGLSWIRKPKTAGLMMDSKLMKYHSKRNAPCSPFECCVRLLAPVKNAPSAEQMKELTNRRISTPYQRSQIVLTVPDELKNKMIRAWCLRLAERITTASSVTGTKPVSNVASTTVRFSVMCLKKTSKD